MTTRDHDGDERKHQTEQRATKPTIRHTRLRATGSHTQQPLKARLTPPCSSLPAVCVKDGTIRPPRPQRREVTGEQTMTFAPVVTQWHQGRAIAAGSVSYPPEMCSSSQLGSSFRGRLTLGSPLQDSRYISRASSMLEMFRIDGGELCRVM